MGETNETGGVREPLSFETDAGASRSVWIALLILLAIILWMGSGFVLPTEDGETRASSVTPAPAAVTVRTSRAQDVTLTFSAEGQAEPDRDTQILAEGTGEVAEMAVRKGQDVEAGALIAQLDTESAEAALAQAQEELTRAQREFDNAGRLLDRGVATADRMAEARADLATAESGVTSARRALDDLSINAPFAGRIEMLSIEEGEFVSAGSSIGRIVDNKPLTVAFQIPQQSLSRIETGQAAEVTFITGQTRQGEVTFVGTAAASETRTFLAEVEVANEDGAIPAGVSAEIRIPTGSARAHRVAPSIVSLNPEGELGVKTVEDGTVVFHPVELVRADAGAVWVKGLPEEAMIITIGQGFVRAGEEVDARPDQTQPAEESP